MPVSEERIGMKADIGPAIYLHEFLIARQTSPDGRVNYGKPISYRWIAQHWPGDWDGRPSERTLRAHLARLKKHGLVRVSVEMFNRGMRIRLVNSVKFAPDARRAPEQLLLLGGPVPISRPVEKPVENRVEIGQTPATKPAARAAETCRFVRQKRAAHQLKEKDKETSNTRTPAAREAVEPDWQRVKAFRQAQKQRRVLGEIERLRAIYAGSSDPAALARRDLRLGELHLQLQQSGWQDERAG
ncbi:MAG: hypothetical protein ACRD4R_06825 [Candidatus Acidiferrales bacterium]